MLCLALADRAEYSLLAQVEAKSIDEISVVFICSQLGECQVNW